MPRVSRTVLEIRNLHPAKAEVLLSDRRFWTEASFDAFVDRCESILFRAPQDGLTLARLAPEFAKKLGCAPGKQAEALSILGNAYRACGLLEESLQTFEKITWSRCSAHATAFCEVRLALLYIDLGRFSASLEKLNQSIAVFESNGDEKQFSIALVIRGILRIEGDGDLRLAILDLARSLAKINARLRPRLFYTAIHNLSVAILMAATDIGDLSTIMSLIEMARRELRRRRIPRKSIPHAKLRWVRALVMKRVGAIRRAEHFLEKAREDFITLGAMTEVAKISLDLGDIYFREKRWADLARISVDTVHLDRSLYDHEILSALLLWRQGILEESLDEKTISFAYEKIYGIKQMPASEEAKAPEDQGFDPIGF